MDFFSGVSTREPEDMLSGPVLPTTISYLPTSIKKQTELVASNTQSRYNRDRDRDRDRKEQITLDRVDRVASLFLQKSKEIPDNHNRQTRLFFCGKTTAPFFRISSPSLPQAGYVQ